MKKKDYIYATMLVIMGTQGCKKPYLPSIVAVSSNYLVVEGVINTGTDSTSIRLSRTVPLSSTTQVKPELGATITIITDGGVSFPLSEKGKGYYTAPGLNLNSTAKYGLKIVTSDGKVYQSDPVEAKNSPPIDSVYYTVQSDGLKIYADTHDATGNSVYYRWDYQETYEFHSAFYSYLYLAQVPFDTVLTRITDNQIYTCWKSDTSTNILLNSSAKLARDVIAGNQVTFVPSTSEKIGVRYSILVKQYALTVDAFNYYQQLEKNTEQLGSIFDAQPSELPGNIHCVTTPSEAVIGYITAGAPAQSRIFIDKKNLHNAWLPVTPYDDCTEDTALFKQPQGNQIINAVKTLIYTGVQVPIYTYQPPPTFPILGYVASKASCVDCTLRGTNKQPSFWTTQ